MRGPCLLRGGSPALPPLGADPPKRVQPRVLLDVLPVQVEPNPFNLRYLRTKKEKMGHLFPASILHGGLSDERPNGPANGAS